MSERTTICAVLVDRANYGRMKPVLQAIHQRPELDLQVVCAGTMVLERFGLAVEVVRGDGLPVVGEVFLEMEGSLPYTMAKSVGLGILAFADEFRRLKPDFVLLIGDRYEALAAAVAAAYMNLTLVHLQGGEVSGSVDESARHAISKFSHYHVPATQRSAEFLRRMGERPDSILTVGCPSSDLAASLDLRLAPEVLGARGSGAPIDPEAPFVLAVFHPSTTEFGGEQDQIRALLAALLRLSLPTVLLWPNIDAGSSLVAKEIRRFRDREQPGWLRLHTNFTPDDYLRVLAQAALAVGNSSSFVRDAGYFGTPVVLVGSRQDGREADEHVTRVEVTAGAIEAGMRAQLAHGRYAPSQLYGDGAVGPRVAAALVGLRRRVQKRLAYVEVEEALPSGG